MMASTFTLNDGTKVPWLAFGTGTALFGKDSTDFVRSALDNGITHLDGAQAYGNEDTLSAGLKASGKSRESVFLVTKLWNLPAGKSVKDSLAGSLQKLGVDYVDLFLIHSPEPYNKEGRLKSLWKEMEYAKAAGLAKSIGVSNFRVEDLETVLEDATVTPAVNQIEFHPYVYKAAEPILEFCKSKGITVASYGGLTPLVRAAGGPVDSVVEDIAAKLSNSSGKHVSGGQVLTKWILQKGAFVVTTTSKISRIKETLETINLPDLSSSDIQAIDEAGSKLHKRIYMNDVFE